MATATATEPEPHSWGTLGRRWLPDGTANATGISRELSRAFTLHAALERLNLLDAGAVEAADTTLHCHLLGADRREGCDARSAAATFAPLCELLAGSGWREVVLLLCGPNCTPPPPAGSDGEPGLSALCTAVEARGDSPALRVRWAQGYYDELCDALQLSPPHLAVAFQAGLWGYSTWQRSVLRVRDAGRPILITSYNAWEADDDGEALREWGDWRWIWQAESNPWRSLAAEPRAGPLPHALFENCVTQCVGGIGLTGSHAPGESSH